MEMEMMRGEGKMSLRLKVVFFLVGNDKKKKKKERVRKSTVEENQPRLQPIADWLLSCCTFPSNWNMGHP
jgi:hypothetical protein